MGGFSRPEHAKSMMSWPEDRPENSCGAASLVEMQASIAAEKSNTGYHTQKSSESLASKACVGLI